MIPMIQGPSVAGQCLHTQNFQGRKPCWRLPVVPQRRVAQLGRQCWYIRGARCMSRSTSTAETMAVGTPSLFATTSPTWPLSAITRPASTAVVSQRATGKTNLQVDCAHSRVLAAWGRNVIPSNHRLPAGPADWAALESFAGSVAGRGVIARELRQSPVWAALEEGADTGRSGIAFTEMDPAANPSPPSWI